MLRVGEKKKAEWLALSQVELEQLAHQVLYVTKLEGDQYREGEIWSRNLELTEIGGGDVLDPSSHRFQRFRDGLYPALRAMTRMPEQYVKGEIPILTKKREQIHWLLTLAIRLRKHDAEQQELFESGARKEAEELSRARNKDKKSAHARLLVASSVTDSRGIRNPGRLPLLLWSSDTALERRVRSGRWIARRMDFRAIVLADYLEQMFSLLRRIDIAVCDKLESKKLFVDRDRHLAVMTAGKMRRFASGELSQVHIRPFRRAIAHIRSEINACADAFEQNELEDARPLLCRIHRSIVMLTIHHRRLEEALMVVSDVRQFKVPLHGHELFDLIELLRVTEQSLGQPEEYTGEFLEEGFTLKVLPKVIPRLAEARAAITDVLHQGDSSQMKDAYEHLKAACAPF